MATLYSANYNSAYVAVPSAKMGIGDFKGEVKSAFATYTLAADATSGDVLKFFKLPKGARVINYFLKAEDLGGTGTLNLGWAASEELSAGSAVEAASASGLLSALDVSGQASVGIPVAGIAGLHKKFAAEADIQAVLPTTGSATGKIVSCQVSYVVE